MQWKDPELKRMKSTPEVRKEFGEEEVVNLSLATMAINCWNRLAIGFRKIPGEYQPQKIG
jgi:alkylhydroperoxidase family enzyme